jgi:CBS domain-containing protein
MAASDIPSIRDLQVDTVMTDAVAPVSADQTAATAAQRLFESDIGSLLVGADTGPPAGIKTETDYVELAATGRDPATVTVDDCMSAPVTTIPRAATLEEAAELMAANNITKLPGLEETRGGVAGLVTTTDIATYLPVHEFHPET